LNLCRETKFWHHLPRILIPDSVHYRVQSFFQGAVSFRDDVPALHCWPALSVELTKIRDHGSFASAIFYRWYAVARVESCSFVFLVWIGTALASDVVGGFTGGEFTILTRTQHEDTVAEYPSGPKRVGNLPFLETYLKDLVQIR